MTPSELLSFLIRGGFSLSLVKNEIKVTPSKLLTAELRAAIKENYRALRTLLKQVQERGVQGIDPFYLRPQRQAPSPELSRWRPGDRPTNKFQALIDLYGDNPDDW